MLHNDIGQVTNWKPLGIIMKECKVRRTSNPELHIQLQLMFGA